MEHGVSLDDHDLVREPLDAEEIRRLADAIGGAAELVSKRSPKYREIAGTVQSDAQWIDAMAREPRLIRRPIWRSPGGIMVGFDPKAWEARLNG